MRNTLDDVLQAELDRINLAEKRNDRPYFDTSFIKEYPGLFGLMWALFILTMALLIYSDSFGMTEYVVCGAIFAVCNFFFFFHINPSYRAKDIDKGALKNCYTGDWYMEVHVRDAFIDQLMSEPLLTDQEKARLAAQREKKGFLYFADIYRLRH
ncbi:YlaC family protein [Pantoea sp. Mb-10]|uniref:YlaC family protein n=1 Tax=unclassified Pantoea TaxID=2630326 RepID=UPI001E3F9B7B|nr:MULTISPECIES: YlaC family protein [unclassified Pantoea]MCE0491210.1 YlaC family protein [Pantoea sp. Mb-10]MCE0502699.1 YlaC family protein [Pantoea sp. Pb-8]